MAWYDLLKGLPYLGIFEGFDPKEPSPGLRPHVYKPGVYKLYRRAFEEIVTFIDPDEDSYELQPFDCEMILRNVVRMSEMQAQKLLDLLWNFRAVRWDTASQSMKCLPVPDEGEFLIDLPRPPVKRPAI